MRAELMRKGRVGRKVPQVMSSVPGPGGSGRRNLVHICSEVVARVDRDDRCRPTVGGSSVTLPGGRAQDKNGRWRATRPRRGQGEHGSGPPREQVPALSAALTTPPGGCSSLHSRSSPAPSGSPRLVFGCSPDSRGGRGRSGHSHPERKRRPDLHRRQEAFAGSLALVEGARTTKACMCRVAALRTETSSSHGAEASPEPSGRCTSSPRRRALARRFASCSGVGRNCP